MCGYRHTMLLTDFFANATGSNSGLNRCWAISVVKIVMFAYSKWHHQLNRSANRDRNIFVQFHLKWHLLSHNTLNVYIFNAYLHTANIYQLSRVRSILLSLSSIQHIHPYNGYSGYMKIIKIIMNEQKQHWNRTGKNNNWATKKKYYRKNTAK